MGRRERWRVGRKRQERGEVKEMEGEEEGEKDGC